MTIVAFPDPRRMPPDEADAAERLDGLMLWLANEIERMLPMTPSQRVALQIAIKAVQDKMDEVLLEK